ncbi:hypothetical protein [Listeria booriae]|uniref:Uncharacterized protein n=1 Tax=Listeria booriae TaxID=1552123 RepID=A0A7X1DSK5_9LIST|nr:hypothetical protein [Listeria booriae]MBC1333478.1 hypothetical protein [Listeria booriae]MBC1403092.1 hypothetical protein [Listeria booriae]MBC1617953.1 hypothetical protein [Listeria booriae]MBC2373645.1 hypothetical protein [Listeria booriae]MBC2388783.1 hypothetical protein [Listeria booriae]
MANAIFSISGNLGGMLGFLLTLIVVSSFLLFFNLICESIVEEKRHKRIGKLIQQEFECDEDAYTILEPTNPNAKGVYDIVAFTSGAYYMIRCSDSKPKKIIVKEKLDSLKDI